MKKGILLDVLIFVLLFQVVHCASLRIGNSQPQTITIPIDYPTIQAGIDHAQAESTIYVKNGIYVENLTITKPLTVVGESLQGTVINATANPIGIYVSAEFVTVENFTITSNNLNVLPTPFSGIVLERCRHCTIMSNFIVTWEYGIILRSSSENTISYNDMSSLYHVHGIELHNSNDNAIFGNDAEHNDVCLIIDGGCRNFVSSNTLGLRVYASAVEILNSPNNVLIKNFIYGGVDGVVLENSQYTSIWHNTIGSYGAFGGRNARVESSYNTSWDAGYPQGGNSWYGYNGTDAYQGTYQNESGSDGIGDVPYVIDASNVDRYPLMQSPSMSSLDIGVADITLCKQVFGRQTSANVTVRIANFGVGDLSTNVTIWANSTILCLFTPSLPGKAVSDFAFVWNTTGLVNASFDISARADSVQNETDTTDNFLDYGTVQFSIPCDVDGDGVVDIFDAIILAGHFNLDSFSPNWNMNVDFNGDGIVDIYDAIILASNYGTKLS